MAITLGALKTYAIDMAYDMAGPKADALALYWINAALETLWRAHPWVHYQARQYITLVPEESGTDAVVTQGSGDVVRGSAWTAKYATSSEAWDLELDGSGARFSIASIATVTATLGTGQVWPGASASDVSYVLSRYRYSLPSNFVRRAELFYDVAQQRSIPYVSPAEFDRIKQQNPGERSSQPYFYTLRGNSYVEFFPAPGSDYVLVDVTYTRKVTTHTSADVDETEVDWPVEFEHVLRLAVEAQAARAQGEAAQAKYEQVTFDLERALLSAKGLDSDRGHQPKQLGLSMGGGRSNDRWDGLYRNPTAFTPA